MFIAFWKPFPDHELGILKGTPQFVVFGHKRQIFFQAEDNSRRKRANFIFSPKAVSVLRWLGNNARFIQ